MSDVIAYGVFGVLIVTIIGVFWYDRKIRINNEFDSTIKRKYK